MSTTTKTTSNQTKSHLKSKKLTKTSKKISLRLDAPLYDYIVKKAASQNRTLSNFIKSLIYDEMDAVDYLLMSPKNVEMLEKSPQEANSQNFIKSNLPENLYKHKPF